MPHFVEAGLWAVTLAAVATVPALAVPALVGLLVAATARMGWRASWRRLAGMWPSPLVGATVVLALAQLPGGNPWPDLFGLLAWGCVLAVILPNAAGTDVRHRAAVADGLLIGTLVALAAHIVLAAPELRSWLAGGAARAAGGTPHPNVLAAAALLASLTLALIADAAPGLRRGLALAGVAASLLLLLASGSRAVVLGAAGGAALWAFVALLLARGRGNRPPRSAALLVLALALAAPLVLLGVRDLTLASLVLADVERAAVMSVALDLAAARPLLGHGAAPWTSLVAAAEPALPVGVFAHAHAVPLHVLVHGGALGLVLAALLLLSGAHRLAPRLASRLGHSVARSGLLGPLSAAVVGGLGLQALVDLVVVDPVVYVAAGGVVAAIVATLQRYHPLR